MYIANPASSRPQYYDRNDAVHMMSYAATAVAPHTVTTRWTYTVPANSKAFIDYVRCFLHRDAAAGAAGQADAIIQYQPSGGSGVTIFGVDESQNATTVFNQNYLAQLGPMFAGDVLAGLTQDVSTTGTYTYAVAAKLDQFDA